MRKNKKIVVLALLATLTLNACGNKENNTKVTPTVEPTKEATIEPTKEPTVTPTEDGGKGETGTLTSNDALNKFHAKAKEIVGENYIPTMAYDAIKLKEVFGIDSAWYDAAIGEGPMMSAHVDELVVVHVTEGNLEKAQKAMDEYFKSMLENTLNYPMNQLKIQGAVVETVGDYVMFVMVGQIDESKYDKEADIIAAFKAENQKVVDEAKAILE